MRRNCNLELRLLPPSASGGFLSADYDSPKSHHRPIGSPKEEQHHHHHQQQQQLTFFYNGKMAVCDVTELQARAILMLASREMEEKSKTPTCSDPTSLIHQSQLYSPTSGLSMKKSLQGFLHKRKNRVQMASPYHRQS